MKTFTIILAIVSITGSLLGQSAENASAPKAESFMSKCTKIIKYGDMISANGPTKKDAVLALGILGDEGAVPLLVEHLENESNDDLKFGIVKALGWIGSKAAVPSLEKALTEKYPHTRKAAFVALKKITGIEYNYDKTGLPSLEKAREEILRQMEEVKKTN